MSLCPFAPAQPEDESTGERWLRQARDAGEWTRGAVRGFVDGLRPDPLAYGISLLAPEAATEGVGSSSALPLPGAGRSPERVVLLIHGLDEPGGVWGDLVPRVFELDPDADDPWDFGVAVFEYPNDQAIAPSATLLEEELRRLRSLGTERIDIVAHSMGGLIARDVLTRAGGYAGRARGHEAFPDVERFIMLGTPHGGSPWARLRALAELRETLVRFTEAQTRDPRLLLGFLNDGVGEAGKDLLPGSDYLTELNGRENGGWPAGARMTLVVGTLAPVEEIDFSWLLESPALARVIGEAETRRLADAVGGLAGSVGDGVVSVESASAGPVEDIVRVDGTHRGMVRRMTVEDAFRRLRALPPAEVPVAVPIVIDRLRQPAESGAVEGPAAR